MAGLLERFLVGCASQRAAARPDPVTEADRAAGVLQVHADRDRIARDLYEHVIGWLYGIGLAVHGTQHLAKSPAVAARIANHIDQLNDVITEIRTAVFDRYTDPAGTPRLGGALHDIVQAITADTEPRKEQRQDERDHLRQRQHGHRRGRHHRGGGRGPATFEIATELIRPGGPVATVGVHGEVGGTQTPGPVDHGHRDHHWTGQRHHDVTPMLLKLVAKASQRRRSRDHPFPFDRIIDADINFARAAETRPSRWLVITS